MRWERYTALEEMLTKGVKPRSQAVGWQDAIARPGVQRALTEFHAANPDVITGVQGLAEAVPEIREKVWNEKIQPAVDRQEHLPLTEMAKVGENVRESITPEMRRFEPEKAAEMERFADEISKQTDVKGANGILKWLNGKITSYFAKYPTARYGALLNNPDIAMWDAARESIRSEMLGAMEKVGETQIREARLDYGGLKTLEKEVERKGNVADRKNPTGLMQSLGAMLGGTAGAGIGAKLGGIIGGPAGALVGGGAGLAAGKLIEHLNDRNVLTRRAIERMRPPAEAPFTPPPAYVEPPMIPATAVVPQAQPFDVMHPPGGGPMAPRQTPGAGNWQTQVGAPPPVGFGDLGIEPKPATPGEATYGATQQPQPLGPIQPPEAPVQGPQGGQQLEIGLPEPQHELFNLSHPAPTEAPKGLGEIGAPEVRPEVGKLGKIQTTPAENLKVGDTFVDEKGDPRRITEIAEDGTIKTADHTMRDYPKGEIDHVGELNSPKAQLARGGMMHPAGEETEIYRPEEEKKTEVHDLGEIGEKEPEIGLPKEEWKPPADLEKGIAKDEAVDTNIPIEKISVSEDAYNRTHADNVKNRGSKTEGPVEIFYNPDNGQFLVEDGMHRIVDAHEKGETSVPAKLWSGYSDTIANVPKDSRMDLSPIVEEEPEIGLPKEAPKEAVEPTETTVKSPSEEESTIGAPRTSKNISPEEAIDALKKRVEEVNSGKGGTSDWFTGKAPRNLKVLKAGELTPEMVGDTAFLLHDGSAIVGGEGVRSHMQLAREVGQDLLNDANAVRVAQADSFELHGMPSDAQLAEMNRLWREVSPQDRQTVHGHNVFWDFFPEAASDETRGYSADAIHLAHDTGEGSFSDFRRAMDKSTSPH